MMKDKDFYFMFLLKTFFRRWIFEKNTPKRGRFSKNITDNVENLRNFPAYNASFYVNFANFLNLTAFNVPNVLHSASRLALSHMQ